MSSKREERDCYDFCAPRFLYQAKFLAPTTEDLIGVLYQAIKLLLWCGCYVNRRSMQLLLVMLIGDLCTLKFAVSIGDPCKLKKFAVNQSSTSLELS